MDSGWLALLQPSKIGARFSARAQPLTSRGALWHALLGAPAPTAKPAAPLSGPAENRVPPAVNPPSEPSVQTRPGSTAEGGGESGAGAGEGTGAAVDAKSTTGVSYFLGDAGAAAGGKSTNGGNFLQGDSGLPGPGVAVSVQRWGECNLERALNVHMRCCGHQVSEQELLARR